MTDGGLVIRDVTKAYEGHPVLAGVDLVVPAGTLTAVLGVSGCGKTTLLRIVAGFETPDAGSVSINGREVVGPKGFRAPEHRQIGYVTQEGNLFPHLTVAGNIAFGLRRVDRRRTHRVHELLELVGLDRSLSQRRPDQLSGGQQQRVALARALATRPGLVLLDEPFSALDARMRESTRRAVAAALAAAGTTTVLVTHDQAEALSLAARVALLRDGRIAADAPPARLYRHPEDREIAASVGDVVALVGTARGDRVSCALGSLRLSTTSADGPGTVLVRPEQLLLDGADTDPAGTVVDIAYYGHDALLRLTVDGAGSGVLSRRPAHLLPAVGDRVRIRVEGEVGFEPALTR